MIAGVVSKDSRLCEMIIAEAKARGAGVRVFDSLSAVQESDLDIVFIDWLADDTAQSFCRPSHDSSHTVVILLPKSQQRLTSRLIDAGASDVLLLPVQSQEIGAEFDDLTHGVRPGLPAEQRQRFDRSIGQRLVGNSGVFKRALIELQKAALSDANVLLLGKTGTGKEGFARVIHDVSWRYQYPYIAQDLGALPATLLESELFGHVRGAFTGAAQANSGRLQSVRAGTLLLDEIGNLDMGVQSKLLRALEAREFYPLGSHKPVQFNGRLICATSVNLDEAVRNARFREDLLSRIDQI
jgi:two-component system response regulator HydG